MLNIPLNEIYQHKLNFLIGSGASYGLFDTLWLAVKDSDDASKSETIETLATKFERLGKKKHHGLLFMYYYKKIIEPACKFNMSACINKPSEKPIIENYKIFLDSIIRVLQQKKAFQRRCNIFTTNYDGCIPFSADELIKEGKVEFYFNDGASGLLARTLSARNFNNYMCQSGIFGKNSSDLPQINFINLHGSVYWAKEEDNIKVDYSINKPKVELSDEICDLIDQFGELLNDETKNTEDLINFEVTIGNEELQRFWDEYHKLPIVNPTKWKFHETVFEEHYYQMLRLLSYQLEEPNSVLISFAFSFADEHILNLIKRSLSNPRLLVFICCFNDSEYQNMSDKFSGYKNVKFIKLDDQNLDFTHFNREVFNTELLREVE